MHLVNWTGLAPSYEEYQLIHLEPLHGNGNVIFTCSILCHMEQYFTTSKHMTTSILPEGEKIEARRPIISHAF